MEVISFCDLSGVMVLPWAKAGYGCTVIDLQHPRGVSRGPHPNIARVGASVFELHPYHRWMPQVDRMAAAFAFPVCTDLTYSGQRWRRENGPTATAEGFRLFAACWDLLRFYERERGAITMLENPRGIPSSWCKADHVFHPWQYGDNESKETHIWVGGGFVMPAPSVLLRPCDVQESCWKAVPGPERANLRSRTPAGFARAVFETNEPRVRERAA
jgi:hypothetical protein